MNNSFAQLFNSEKENFFIDINHFKPVFFDHFAINGLIQLHITDLGNKTALSSWNEDKIFTRNMPWFSDYVLFITDFYCIFYENASVDSLGVWKAFICLNIS